MFTGFCFSPRGLRKGASSCVSPGGGVRLRLTALGFPGGVRKGISGIVHWALEHVRPATVTAIGGGKASRNTKGMNLKLNNSGVCRDEKKPPPEERWLTRNHFALERKLQLELDHTWCAERVDARAQP